MADVCEEWGVDVSVSTPHLLTGLVEEAVSVGSFVRLLSFAHGAARLAEVTLADTSPAVGREIVQLGLPRESTIVALLRQGQVVVPRGDTVLHRGDEVVVLVTGLVGCPDRNRGISPVGKGLYFPSGIALDPRIPEDRAARWLFVLNGNSDLVYNAGSVVPVDLNKFFADWMLDPERCFGFDGEGRQLVDEDDQPIAPDARFCVPAPCEGCKAPDIVPDGEQDALPVVGDVGFTPTDEIPCRRNTYKPQVVECEDTFFIREDAAVHRDPLDARPPDAIAGPVARILLPHRIGSGTHSCWADEREIRSTWAGPA